MRVRMVTTAAGPAGVWEAGSVQDVSRETGEALIAGGYAVDLEPLAERVPLGREASVVVKTSAKRARRKETE